MPTMNISVIKKHEEFIALYRRLRDENVLKYLCLSYKVDSITDEEWWAKYFDQPQRLMLAGFIDNDFVGVMPIVPFWNMLSNTAEIGICCMRKWIRERELIRELFRMGVRYVFEILKACSVVCCIPRPNLHARLATKEFGMRYLCTIPGMAFWADKNSFVDVDMYINTREEIEKEFGINLYPDNNIKNNEEIEK